MSSTSPRRPFAVLIMLSMLGALLPTALFAGFAPAAIAGPDDFSLTKSGPDDVLIGEIATFTLTADGTQATDVYNVGFRDVLPAGTAYVVGSGDPSPAHVLADTPGVGETTLIWENVADLPTGSKVVVTYDVDTDPDTDPATLPVGTSFVNSAQAVGNADAFTLPDVDPVAGTFSGDFTGEAFDTTSTPVLPYRLKKRVVGESAILRGVHQAGMGPTGGTTGTIYEIELEGNPNYSNTGFTITDTLDPYLEFLGCSSYLPGDNTTDVPFNGDADLDEEWPGSGEVAPGSNSANCLTPNSVDTTGAGETVVQWSVPTLGAGATEIIEYSAGIAMRANCATFTGTRPSAASLDQGRNLDNNCGEATNENDMTSWPNPNLPELLSPNEDDVDNTASTCGVYTPGVFGPDYDACSTETLVVQAEDLVLGKSITGTLAHGNTISTTLTASASEYRDFTDLEIRDLLPSGLCYRGTGNDVSGTDWSTNDCAGAASAPLISVDGSAPVAAPATSIDELADGRMVLVWNHTTIPLLTTLDSDSVVTITFDSTVRVNYRSGFAPSTPVLAGDTIENFAEVSGFDAVTGENTNTESIDNDPADPGINPDGDTASAEISAPTASIRKYVSVKPGGPLDETQAPDPNTGTDCADEYANITWLDSAGGAPDPGNDTYAEGYSPGDIVCFLLTASFPAQLDYANVTITDLMPPGYTYVAGSAARITTSTTNIVGGGTVPADTLGAGVTASGSGSKVTFDAGNVDNIGNSFTWVLAAELGPPGANNIGDIVFNQQKMVHENTAGEVFQYRDMAGAVWEEPEVQIAKGIDSVASVSTDVAVAGPQGVDFDNSYFDDLPSSQEVEAGAVVTYRVDSWNTGNKDAENVEIWDVLPDDIVCSDISAISDGGVCGIDGSRTIIKWPATLDLAEDYPNISYRPGGAQSASYTYDLTVPLDVAPGRFFDNIAGVRAYSAPINADNAGYPYVPAGNIDPTQEPSANAADADDQALITTPNPSVAKTQRSGMDEGGNSANASLSTAAEQVTIGEILQYRIRVTIPEGTTAYDAVVTDTLPAGLTYFEGPARFNDANATRSPSVSMSAGTNNNVCGDPAIGDLTTPAVGSGGTLTLTFPCDYENPTGSGDDVVDIMVWTQVDDVPGNVARPTQTSFANRARIDWDNETGGSLGLNGNTVTARVVEPNPTIVKDHTVPTGSNPVSPGGTATWRVRVSNPTAGSSNVSTLHDVVIVDQLPLEATPLDAPGGSVVDTTGDTVEGPSGSIGVWNNSLRTITWSVAQDWNPVTSPHALEELAPGAAVTTMDFVVELDTFLPSSFDVLNTAELTGDTLPLIDPSNDPGDQDAREYSVTDDDALTVENPELVKDVEPLNDPAVDTTTWTVGQPVEFSVTFVIPEDVVAYDTSLFDTLPTELDFDRFGNTELGDDPIIGANCFRGTSASISGPLAVGDVVTIQPVQGNNQRLAWYFGDVVADNGDCEITVPYTVHLNSAADDGESFDNEAQLGWNQQNDIVDSSVTTDMPGAFDDPSDFDGQSTVAQETLDVVEPQLELDKDVSLLPGATAIAPCDTTGGNDTASSNDADGTPGSATSGVADGNGCDVETGSTVRYTLTVDNDAGTSAAHDVTVVDTVPTGVFPLATGAVRADGANTDIPGPVSGATGVWDNSARTITWTFAGPLAEDASFTLDYDAELDTSDSYLRNEDLTNAADIPTYFGLPLLERNQIVADNAGNDDIPTYGNDAAATRGAVDPDEVAIEVRFPDLQVVKDAGGTSVADDARLDEPFTWEITVSNLDTAADAYGIDVTDVLPVGWTYVPNSAQVTTPYGGPTQVEPTCSADTGSCNDAASLNIETLVWTDLTSGPTQPLSSSQAVTIVFQAIPQEEALIGPGYLGAGNEHTNSVATFGDDVTGSSSCCGGTPYTDTDTHDVTLQIFDLALRKSVTNVDTAVLSVGTNVTFAVTVTNQGTTDATDVEITDYVQPAFVFNAADNTAAATGNANDWDGTDPDNPTIVIPSIDAGDSATVLIVLELDDTSVEILNLAEISGADDDGNGATAPPIDIDSTPDDTQDEYDEADQANDATVDDIIDNSGGDEDDHDIAKLPVFDLALRKVVNNVSPLPLRIGAVVTYDIEVINQGSIAATDVVISDYIQPGFAYDPAENTAALTGNDNDWGGTSPLATLDVGNVPVGGSVTVQINLTVTDGAAPLDNLAEISEYDDDGNGATPRPDDTDSVADTTNSDVVVDDAVDQAGIDGDRNPTGADEDDHDVASLDFFDLALRKTFQTANPSPLQVGSVLTYQFEVINQGSVDATDVELTDYVPAGLVFNAADNTAAATGNANDWDGTDPDNPTLVVPTVNAGTTETVTIRLEFVGTPGGGQIVNAAEISSFDNDNNPVTPPPVDIDSDADAVDDDDVEDDEVDENGIDDTTGDGTADEDDHDVALLPVFDLALRKTIDTVDPTPAAVGSTVTFEIEVFNQGGVDATDIVITDYIGDGFAFDPSENTAALTGNANDWDGTDPDNPTLLVGDLTAGDSVTVTIVADIVGTPASGPLMNTAEITDYDDDGNGATPRPGDVDSSADALDDDDVEDDEIDENGTDDTTGDSTADEDDHDIAVIGAFDLALRKTLDSITPLPTRIGSIATFEIEVFNQGSSDAYDVAVTDYVASGFAFDPALNTAAATGNANNWIGPVNRPVIVIPTIPIGGSETVVIVLEVTGSALENHAEISAADDDGDPLTPAPVDLDSTPDGIDDNDAYEDDEIDENGIDDTSGDGTADEDDHDGWTGDVFDLALRKTITDVGDVPLVDGTAVTYAIEVFNQGTLDATDVVISDYIDPGLAFDPAANTAALTGNANDWSADLTAPTLLVGDISAGASTTVTIVLTVPVVPATPTTFVNSAEITSADDDGDALTPAPSDIDSTSDAIDDDVVEDDEIDENGRDDATGDGLADEDDHDIASLDSEIFDLALTKQLAGDSVVDVGDDLTFRIEVTNQGELTATDIEITDTLPESLELATADENGWSDDGDGTLTVTLPGPLAPTETVVVELVATVQSGFTGQQINLAEISGAADENGNPRNDVDSTPDADPTNDRGGDPVDDDDVIDNTDNDEDDHDPAVFRIREVNLAITKALTGAASSGANAQWALTVSNVGPDLDAGPISVTDTLPTGLRFVSATGDGWSCSGTNGSMTCVTETGLAPGDTLPVITVNTAVTGAVGQQVVNVAAVLSSATDIQTSNNSGSASTLIQQGSGPSLPFSGAQVGMLLALAALLIGSGVTIVAIDKRRTREATVTE